MPRTVSASEAKTNFGSLVNWAVDQGDDVIVESHGKPKAVIIPFEAYRSMLKLREEARRLDALARLEALGERIRARNQDLSIEEAESLAERATQEVVGEMMAEGKIAYRGQ